MIQLWLLPQLHTRSKTESSLIARFSSTSLNLSWFCALLFGIELLTPLPCFASNFSRIAFTNSQGIKISYQVGLTQSSNPRGTVVIFPGIFMTGDSYRALGDEARNAEYDVFILEPRYSHRYLPIPGISPDSSGADIVDNDFGELVAEVRQRARAVSFHWVGHSFGGIAALSLLTRDGALEPKSRPMTFTISGATDDVSELNPALRGMNIGWAMTQPFWNPFQIPLIPIPFLVSLMNGGMGSIPVTLLSQMSIRPDLNFLDRQGRQLTELQALRVPTLILHGQFDVLLTSTTVEKFMRRIPALLPKKQVTVALGTHDFILNRFFVRSTWKQISDWIDASLPTDGDLVPCTSLLK